MSKTRETFRILVVGVGSIGERHVRCFQGTQRCRVSICEINSSLRNEVSSRYNLSSCFADIDSALAEPHDAAVIAVPAHLHIPIALRAAAAGFHLLIEKPLSVSTEGIGDLKQMVERMKLVANVAYVQRAHPALSAMRRAIIEGRFGAPLQLVAVSGQHFPKYRPTYRDTYYTDRTTGGGAIQDAMTHMFDAGQWLVGPMDRLVADADHKVLAGTDVEDAVHVLARHGRVMACYSLNQFQPQNEKTITVICERGTACFEYHRDRWRWLLEADEPWTDEAVGQLERDTLFIQQANRFLDSIEHDAEPLCSLDEGIRALRANLATLSSIQDNGWVTISEDTAPTN